MSDPTPRRDWYYFPDISAHISLIETPSRLYVDIYSTGTRPPLDVRFSVEGEEAELLRDPDALYDRVRDFLTEHHPINPSN